MLKGFFPIVVSSLFFLATIIAGLFYLDERGVLYYALLFLSASFFILSLVGPTIRVVKAFVEDYRRHKSFLDFLYDFFSSLKLAIFLMVSIGVLSMLGSTYIQQNQPLGFYLDKFGVDVGLWFWKLWLTDVFHSWYYMLLIVLLAVNLIVCSVKRLPRVWIQTFTKERFQRLDQHTQKHLKPISIKTNSSKDKVIAFLKKMGFKVYTEEEDGKVYFYGEKGRYSRLGVYVVHIGLLVIMAGALIDAIWGVRGSVIVPEGSRSDTLVIPSKEVGLKLPFQIELENFRIVTYGEEAQERGKKISTPFKDDVASFESDIRIIKDGKVVAEGMTAVNSPFDFGTYRIFQATYGLTGEAGTVRLVIFDKEKAVKDPRSALVGEVVLKAGKVAEFKDMLLSIDRSTLNIENEQAGMNGDLKPALVVKVLLNHKAYDVPVVYSPELTLIAYNQMKELKDFPYVFFMSDFRPRFFSGFQVSRQPGTPIVWLGSIMVVGGMIVAFYTIHRKVWMRLEGDTLWVAFWSHKLKEDFKRSFIKALEELKHEGTSDGKESYAA
ncbi:ResB family protein [Hydrogenobacter thermophilus TK-6]|uniref:Cytochrome c biogenesis protein n=1 Tax=Hydrogenobacter thermophilus (strain DSM 6534 / IAM 12695 / TK-6) TaxID=608538 RepID=D3DG00_HYDTT|nr:cytochrome c biogenesis protein ResB [Hydrogenobacter thermophilus]ADO44686.1 ResB family protein [Hydrogenobacter thermophilus TK-6]BAI68752.1 cytochrome c biogenesis protein [Hydrogenobacter thermophilus TK-6]